MFPVKIYEILTDKLRERTPFAFFRLPGADTYRFDGDDDFRLSFTAFNRPFATGKSLAEMDVLPDLCESTERGDYIAAVKDIAEKHRVAGGGKTVLSRIIGGKCDTEGLLNRVSAYFEANKDAFCLFALFPCGRIFLMATPELLLNVKNGIFSTMALAGTRQKGSVEPWDKKNTDEQALVADFVSQKLADMHLQFEASVPYTRRSNNIEHICTDFKGNIPENIRFSDILDILSPTPAVCGYPRETALDNIERYEDSPRDLYAGYTVVYSPDGEVSAFVNLRCVCIDLNTGRYNIRVGGGITSFSEPESEYKETQLKAAPIIKLLDKEKRL